MSMGQNYVMEEYLQFYIWLLGEEGFPWLLREVKMEATRMWIMMGKTLTLSLLSQSNVMLGLDITVIQ